MANAFPGSDCIGHAQGNRHAFQGGNPTVYKITNRNWTGSGSPSEALSASGNRVIIFEVGGEWIVNGTITIGNGNVWVAAQTAPGDVVFRDCTLKLTGDNQLWEHVIVRRNDVNDDFDCWSLIGATNIYLNHVEGFWATDETVGISTNCDQVTIANSLFAEPIEGGFGAKMMLINSNDSDDNTNITIHRNLFAHGKSRNWKVRNPSSLEASENVIYNPGPSSADGGNNGNNLDLQMSDGANASAVRMDYFANYWRRGPNSGAGGWIAKVNDRGPASGSQFFLGTAGTNGNIHWSARNADVVSNDVDDVFHNSIDSGFVVASQTSASSGTLPTDNSALDAYNRLITDGFVGARPGYGGNDQTQRILSEVIKQEGGYPDMVEGGSNPAVDEWPAVEETSHTLTTPSDPWGASSKYSGYTNFEEWVYDNYTTPALDVNASAPATPSTGGGTPTIESVQASTETGNTQTPSIALPATIASGRLILVFSVFDGGSTVVNWDNSTAGTWTELDSSLNELLSLVHYKIADGTEGGKTLLPTVDVSGQEMAAYVVVIDGWHGTTPPEIAVSNADTATPDPPSLNPTGWDTENTLWLAVAHWDGEVTHSAYPSGFENTYNVSTGGAGGVGQAFCSKLEEVASQDPGSFTLSGSDGTVAYTVAVRPETEAAASTGPKKSELGRISPWELTI